MSCKVLQRLLSSGEYDEFEDVVIAEGEFLESDSQQTPIRQVILGMTPLHLIITTRYVTNYKDHPEVYYQTEIDLDLNDLEVSSVWPICLIRVGNSQVRYELNIQLYDKQRHYQLINTHLNGDLDETWKRWLERIQYLREDPYGYIRAQFDEHNIPYPSYFTSGKTSRDLAADDNFVWKFLEPGDTEHVENEVDDKVKGKKKKKKKGNDLSTDKSKRTCKLKKLFMRKGKHYSV